MTVKKILSTVLLSSLLLAMAGCGGGKKVVTVDDSADYQSARALPPLKKPSNVSNTQAEPAVAQVPSAPSVSTVSGASEPLAQQEPLNAESVVVAENLEQAPEVEPAPVSAPTKTPAPVTEPAASNISARVIKIDGQARLEIDADFDQSWAYLSRNLKKSDVTIFSRNKAAGQFAIGCGALESAPAVEKKGRWSFFNRGKQQPQEYCALRLIEKRGITTVAVINRAGAEVSGDYSNDVFNRILNN